MTLYRNVLNLCNYIATTILYYTAVTGDPFSVKLSLFQKTLSSLKTFFFKYYGFYNTWKNKSIVEFVSFGFILRDNYSC